MHHKRVGITSDDLVVLHDMVYEPGCSYVSIIGIWMDVGFQPNAFTFPFVTTFIHGFRDVHFFW